MLQAAGSVIRVCSERCGKIVLGGEQLVRTLRVPTPTPTQGKRKWWNGETTSSLYGMCAKATAELLELEG